jgi:hypothetical protein
LKTGPALAAEGRFLFATATFSAASIAVSDFLESFPKVSSNHCFSDSSNGLLRVLITMYRGKAEMVLHSPEALKAK